MCNNEVKVRTMVELAQEAIDVQSACNLSGCVHSFSRAMTNVRTLEQDKGTAYINSHPIAILYTDKIASLVSPGSSLNGTDYAKAYNWAMDLIEGKAERL